VKKTDLPAIWVQEFDSSVRYNEEKTGVPVDLWRSAGTKTKSNPFGEDLAWWQDNGLDQVNAYWDWLHSLPSNWKIATMPDGKPGIEWGVEVEFGGSLVKGFIDCIFEVDGELVLIDFKSGKKTPFGVIQLALYACAIERAHGVRPKWGGFYMTRKAEVEELVDLKWWRMPYFDYCFSAMNNSIESGYFMPIVSDACNWACSYQEQCVAVGGKESDKYPLHQIKEKP
jgi:hypothetical protein